MTVINRTNHRTVTNLGGRQRKVKISNWENYKNSSSIWLPTVDGDPVVTLGEPSDWEGGNFEFSVEKTAQPLQFWAGDTSDPNNKALICFRKSNDPSCWARIKAMGIDNNGIEPELTPNDRGVRWVDLWTNTNLKWVIKRGSVSKNIRLKSAGHPANFRFRLVLPATLDHEIIGSRLRIFRKSDGSTAFISKFAHGQDANGDKINTTLVSSSDAGNGDPTFRIIPDANDLASAVYPVDIDPTVTIDGTTDIEDTMLYEFNPDRNWGASNLLIAERSPGSGSARSIVIKILSSALPEGNLTEVRWFFHYGAASTTTSAVGRILPGNDFVEGNSSNADEAGASCWTYSIHNTQSWVGAAGCSTAGTDYSSTDMTGDGGLPLGGGGSFGNYTFHSNGLAEFQGWANGDFENNGFIIWRKQPTGRWRIDSTEDVDPHYFEIDYEEISNTFGFFFNPA